MTGQRMGQTGWFIPSKSASREVETGGRIHRFLWLRSRAVSDAKQELSGKDAEKSFRAESSNPKLVSWFRRIAVTERVKVATVHQYGRGAPATSATKSAPERSRKAGQNEHSRRGGKPSPGRGMVKPFQNTGDVKTHRWIVIKSNLRDKRTDPWPRGMCRQSRPCPGAKRPRREAKSQACLGLVRRRTRKRPSKRAKRPRSKINAARR